MLGDILGGFQNLMVGTPQERQRHEAAMAAQAAAPVAAPALGQALGVGGKAAAAGGAPGVIGALGGPAGIAIGLGSALIGGIAEAAKKRKEGQIAGLQATGEGAANMSKAQQAGLANLMSSYQGILG